MMLVWYVDVFVGFLFGILVALLLLGFVVGLLCCCGVGCLVRLDLLLVLRSLF